MASKMTALANAANVHAEVEKTGGIVIGLISRGWQVLFMQRFGTKGEGIAEVCRVLAMMVKEKRNG